MKQIRILAVGKTKTPYWADAIAAYHKRLRSAMRFEELWVKDADAALPLEKRLSSEAERLARHIQAHETVICLDERGKQKTSCKFAAWIQELWDANRPPVFIIGGAFGLCPSIKQRAHHCMSLSTYTFPHELAKVLLYEQIYRAENILAGTGYHHD